MSLLDKLWDDTVAGPRPERGLGKLRRSDSVPNPTSHPIRYTDVPVSRAITIIKANSDSRTLSTDSSSVPSSPAGSSTPNSPLSPGTPKWDVKRLMRRKSMSAAVERAEPRSPTVYDWVVISAIDR
ncbi:Dormancyauxin associated [Macleaya cordata]|uniref:Dormancyauxin associated n=1 Tax=Macleaya cordata TaxID=56857 RepID=A0A200QPI9_MACCD|nr:Dormancyauxin associated [Macleaya cordata]